RREDFEDFDDFVACQVEREAARAPATKASSPHGLTAERQAALDEVSEAAYAGDRHKRERAAAMEARERKLRDVSSGLLVPGFVSAATGTGLVIASMASSSTVDDGGPQCVVGKRCGDACIALTDTCHIGDPRVRTNINGALLGSGVALLVVGAGLLIGGTVALNRWAAARAARFRLTGTGATIEVRF